LLGVLVSMRQRRRRVCTRVCTLAHAHKSHTGSLAQRDRMIKDFKKEIEIAFRLRYVLH